MFNAMSQDSGKLKITDDISANDHCSLVADYRVITVITAVITLLPGIRRGSSKNAVMLPNYLKLLLFCQLSNYPY